MQGAENRLLFRRPRVQSPETFQKVQNRDGGSHRKSELTAAGEVDRDRSERNEPKFAEGPWDRLELIRKRRPILPVITIRTKLCRFGTTEDVSSI